MDCEALQRLLLMPKRIQGWETKIVRRSFLAELSRRGLNIKLWTGYVYGSAESPPHFRTRLITDPPRMDATRFRRGPLYLDRREQPVPPMNELA
ncbi:hypothetical protein EVAR_2338_1 [Eumeta japonica]|uniref:Uncharacterized protein n=1 Tax=Eumeta variegata TaxID=151549 RepID=A0A4C1SI74_EUMVA|nr:hypothetical protein EVAR_2338_1 [Eumeta japonica]